MKYLQLVVNRLRTDFFYPIF